MRKRDLCFIFIIIILSLFSIVITGLYLTKHVIKYNFIMEQISFASSIVSILLAIIAIIYAFVQSYQSGIQNQAMQNVLTLISNKVEGINVVKEEVTNSKLEIKTELAKMHAIFTASSDQIDSHAEKDPVDKYQAFKSFTDSYFKSVIKEADSQTSTETNNVQDFHIIFVPKVFQDTYLQTVDAYDVADEYIIHFRKHSSLVAIGSNTLTFSDYTGMSITLGFKDTTKEWTAQEVKKILDNYEHSHLKIFTVAKLSY
ncbi:hypothetical protein [Bacillus cereus]|uniref:hypothetical protein n=1 Tax=Bacillus cereus TaxID=1396 RepID=UPI000BFC10CE|nr:hypothetical protein [Bacillus cereus]PGU78806.1 hypothetical protein COD76_23275 [Bacillus cereus]